MKRLLSSLLLIAASLSGQGWADDSYLEARRLAEEGRILPLEQILSRIGQFRQDQILEVELDQRGQRLIYEIELLDDRGTVWELQVDAVTGEIVERELED